MLHFFLRLEQAEVSQMHLFTLLHRQILQCVRIVALALFFTGVGSHLNFFFNLQNRRTFLLLNKMRSWFISGVIGWSVFIFIRVNKLFLGDLNLRLFLLRRSLITIFQSVLIFIIISVDSELELLLAW